MNTNNAFLEVAKQIFKLAFQKIVLLFFNGHSYLSVTVSHDRFLQSSYW